MSYQIKDADGNPLVKNGVEVVGSDITNVVKGVNMDKRTMTMIGSTEDPDRDGDVIVVNGWDLNNYLKNPVILWGHIYSQAPLAAAVKVIKRRSPARLEFTMKYPTLGVNPFADMILELFEQKIMNASSVGFMPKEWEKVDPEDESYWAPRKYMKQELLELSMVSVPANPHAVQNAMNFAKGFDNGAQMLDILWGRDEPFVVEDAVAEIEDIKAKGAEYEEETEGVFQVPDDIKGSGLEEEVEEDTDIELPKTNIKVLEEEEYNELVQRITDLENQINEVKESVTSVPGAPKEDPPNDSDPIEVILSQAKRAGQPVRKAKPNSGKGVVKYSGKSRN